MHREYFKTSEEKTTYINRLLSLLVVMWLLVTASHPEASTSQPHPIGEDAVVGTSLENLDHTLSSFYIEQSVSTLDELKQALASGNFSLQVDPHSPELDQILDFLDSQTLFYSSYTAAGSELQPLSGQVNLQDTHLAIITDLDCLRKEPLAKQPPSIQRFIRANKQVYMLSSIVEAPSQEKYYTTTLLHATADNYPHLSAEVSNNQGLFAQGNFHGVYTAEIMGRQLDHNQTSMLCFQAPDFEHYQQFYSWLSEQQPASIVVNQSLAIYPYRVEKLAEYLQDFQAVSPQTVVAYFNSYGNNGREDDSFSHQFTYTQAGVMSYLNPGELRFSSSRPVFNSSVASFGIAAPGITTVNVSPTETRSFGGTSAAAPLLSGSVATYLETLSTRELTPLAALNSYQLAELAISAQAPDATHTEYLVLAGGEVPTTTVTLPVEILDSMRGNLPGITQAQQAQVTAVNIEFFDNQLSHRGLDTTWGISYPFTSPQSFGEIVRSQSLVDWLQSQVYGQVRYSFLSGQEQTYSLQMHYGATNFEARRQLFTALQGLNYNPDVTLNYRNGQVVPVSYLTLPENTGPGFQYQIYLPLVSNQ